MGRRRRCRPPRSGSHRRPPCRRAAGPGNAGSCSARACSATGNAGQIAVGRERRAAGGRRTAVRRAGPTGRGATWARIGRPSATAASIRPRRSRQASGWRWLWASESDRGTPRARHHGAHQLELAVGVGPEVGDELHHAMPGVGHARAMASSSSVPARSDGVGSPLAVRWFRVREVEKPMAPSRMASVARRAHGGAVLRRRLLQPGGPLAHDVEAQRAVGELRAQVDVVRAPLDRVEVLAEALPGPVDALVEHGARDVLDPFHERDEARVRVRPHRGEADAAVAHDRRRDAVPARRRQSARPTSPARRSACGCRRSPG